MYRSTKVIKIKLKIYKSLDFSDLIKKVASKGGTTEKALMYFSKNDKLEHIINDAIKKAEKKSKDLSKYYN